MTLLLLVTLTASADEVETLTYQLTAAGKPAGQRTVTVTYLQEEEREVRILESYQELTVPSGKSVLELRQRLGGRGGATTFTASTSQGEALKEVQAVKRSTGWQVTVIEPDHLTTEEVSLRDVDATSLTLVDPGAQGFLSNKTTLSVLTAETGAVVSGAIKAGGSTTVKLGGAKVSGELWRWSLESGEAELVYGESGHLLRYTLSVGGTKVEAQLTAAPSARTYGEALEVDGLITTGSISEQPL